MGRDHLEYSPGNVGGFATVLNCHLLCLLVSLLVRISAHDRIAFSKDSALPLMKDLCGEEKIGRPKALSQTVLALCSEVVTIISSPSHPSSDELTRIEGPISNFLSRFFSRCCCFSFVGAELMATMKAIFDVTECHDLWVISLHLMERHIRDHLEEDAVAASVWAFVCESRFGKATSRLSNSKNQAKEILTHVCCSFVLSFLFCFRTFVV